MIFEESGFIEAAQEFMNTKSTIISTWLNRTNIYLQVSAIHWIQWNY